MDDQIQAGDMVTLKSGGPLMTVESIDDDGAVCHWFDDKKQPQVRVYAVVLLKKDDGLPFLG